MPICTQTDVNAEPKPPGVEQGKDPIPWVVASDAGQAPCYASKAVIHVTQLQRTGLKLQFRDRAGQPITLPEDTDKYYVRFSVKESPSSIRKLIDLPADEVAPSGLISLTLQTGALLSAGIFTAEITAYDAATDAALVRTQYWLEIAPTNDARSPGPITIAEIRLYLRDICPQQNFLLDDLEFNDSEIAAMIRRPVDEFNETWQPTTQFTTRNFPFRYNWAQAVVGYLMQSASFSYARNNLQYQASDVSINDKNKSEIYAKLAADLLKQWKDFIRSKKMEINIQGAFSTQRSGYSFGRALLS